MPHSTKRIYLSVRSLLPAGAALLLGRLDFSGYSKTPDVGTAEYGASTVGYKLKVRVTDQDAKPVEDLRVDLPSSCGGEKEPTNAQGDAEIGGSYMGLHRDHQVVLEVKDIDGEKSGVVADKQVAIEAKESDFVSKGSRKQSNGKVEKTIEIQVGCK